MDGAANPFAQAYHGHTTIHPLGLIMVVAMGVAMMWAPRRYALWPVMVIVCFVPTAHRLIIFGADFTLLRLMLLFGMARIVLRNEARGFTWKPLDWAVVAWAVYGFLIVVLRLGLGVLVTRLGDLYDVLGMYFLFRILVRDCEDVRLVIRGFMWVSLPVGAFFLVEQLTAHNLFSMFGGVPLITLARDDRLRCQGAFDHPILAGCFFAALLPLIASEWWREGRPRVLAVFSSLACVFIVITSASATPITGLIFAAVGALFFPLRRSMRPVRWGILVLLIALHMLMKAPVWHLIARISVSSGSAWHRFSLIDGAINHADEWWLIGSDVGSAHWGHFTHDVTNYYVVQGLHGGLPLLLLFIAVIAFAFRSVGQTWRRAAPDRAQVVLSWAIGVSFFVHATNQFGVSYFGQIWMSWYLVLAMIGSLAPCRFRGMGSSPTAAPMQKRTRKEVRPALRRQPVTADKPALVRGHE